MADRLCEYCDRRLPKGARADARYCSTRCRVAAHRARHEPAPSKPAPHRASLAPADVRTRKTLRDDFSDHLRQLEREASWLAVRAERVLAVASFSHVDRWQVRFDRTREHVAAIHKALLNAPTDARTICTTCGASGRLPDGHTICPTCEGTGLAPLTAGDIRAVAKRFSRNA
jgi:hypothetical protein